MKARILFADSDRRIRQFCKRELESPGYSVILAEDGEEAVAVTETSRVGVAVLDEHMPGGCGREAAQSIRRLQADLPVILFTADTDCESHQGSCIDRTVLKSEDLRPLNVAIADLLRQVRP